MRLAANLSWLYTEFDFPERLQACADDGFRHAECMFPYDYSATLLREKADSAGVSWVLINAPAGDWAAGDRGLAAYPERRDEFRRSAEQAARYAQVLGVQKIHVLAGIVDLENSDAVTTAWACYEKNLLWLADTMKGEPIDWLIEPINRFDIPGYLLADQATAHELVNRLGQPNLGVQMDLYHCQRAEGNALAALAQYLPTGRIRHLQIAGVPKRDEPQGETSANELVNGAVLNYAEVYQQLLALGYSGDIGCEYRPKATTREGLGWVRNTGFSGTMEAFKPRA
ncbi:MAG: TIM barrel protein [Limnobacter sp.]|uniref:hydroxypyruvate isomerase family protein n=1 Tax=Limnobacter sp. TaxID=2003368 RepID=UPI0022C3C1DE|nr:TIM barrel protein [Limnobacter sp.]MCZ8016268.1 TIM barrel protein [Limnobacter sp.]